MIELRPYQHDALTALHAAEARGVLRPLVAMATGTGKTCVFSALLRQRRGRAVVLAHRDELIEQAAEKLRMIWPEARTGIVKAERDETGADVVVASIQTLARPARLARLLAATRGGLFDKRPFETVICDEAHHGAAETYLQVFRGLGCLDEVGPMLVGFTATPERSDDKGLAAVFQEIVYTYTILDGIRQGFLCDLRAKQVKLRADFNRLHVRAGEFRDEETAEMLLNAEAPRHAAQAYLDHARGRRALVFTPTVAVALAMAEAFRAAGVPAEAAHGEMEVEARRGILARLQRGETLVVPNAQLFTEGTDLPSVSCIVVARPCRSRPTYTQMVGRGTRIYPGKTDCLILDLVGVADRHDVATMASLFNVDSESRELSEKGLVAALAAAGGRDRERRAADGDEAREGQLVSVDVELFKGRDFAWVASPGGDFVLSLGQQGQLLMSQTDPDRWSVVRQWREVLPGRRWPVKRAQLLAEGLSLEYAQGFGEDYVRKSGAAALNARDAAWRKLEPTERQVDILKRRKQWLPGMNRGQASDALTALFAR